MYGDMMHKVNIPNQFIRTDLILEQDTVPIHKIVQEKQPGVFVTHMKTEDGVYKTIEFQDITDHDEYVKVEDCFKKELKEVIKPHHKDVYLIVGLGNPKSTPDSLGPKTLDEILVTRYLFLLGEVEKGFSNVSILQPNVCGNTGIESVLLIKNVIKEIKPTKVIVIDALKASKLDRLVKTIQITDTGIHPGSGIFNDQGEISSHTVSCQVFAIGVPTVVDKNTMMGKDSLDNFMVTPTNIDFLMERLAFLIGNCINHILHQSYFDK